MNENLSPQFIHILTVLERSQFLQENDPIQRHLSYFCQLAQKIRTRPYHYFRGLEDKKVTPKIEVWLYTMSAAKTLAIGAIELLSVGIILLEKSKDAFEDDYEYCKAILSFLIEAQEIISKMYISFPEFDEAAIYYEEHCRRVCLEFGVSLEGILEVLKNNIL